MEIERIRLHMCHNLGHSDDQLDILIIELPRLRWKAKVAYVSQPGTF